jgi:hypothetical protein
MTKRKREEKGKEGNPGGAITTVGGQIQRTARSPFMMASEVVLHIPTDLEKRYIYAIPGSKTPKGDQLFGLHRAALDDIKEAAGIVILESRVAPGTKLEADCVTWQVKGRRDHVDGFVQEETATYTLDLRRPRQFDPESLAQEGAGGRYYELYEGYYAKALDDLRKQKNLPWKGGAEGVKQQLLLEREEGDEWVHEQRLIAHRRALRELSRMSPHITRRAETGAIHALIRNLLGVQHAYTMSQLQAGIKVIRAQQNREALESLPEEFRVKLLAAEAAQALGITPEYLETLMLPSPDRGPPPPPDVSEEPYVEFDTPEGEPIILSAEEEGNVIDGTVIEEEEERVAVDTSELASMLDKLSVRLAELGDDAQVTEGKDRFAVQQVYEALGLKAPNWSNGLTVKEVSEAIKPVSERRGNDG